MPLTKNGECRVVYLNQLSQEVLRNQMPANAKSLDRVFSVAEECTPDNISKGFAAVCRRMEIEDFRFHDLRHTAASWMRMQGADIHTVAQQLAHKDLRMAARYQHLSPEFRADAVARLDGIFGEVKQLESSATAKENNQSSSSIVPTASPALKIKPKRAA